MSIARDTHRHRAGRRIRPQILGATTAVDDTDIRLSECRQDTNSRPIGILEESDILHFVNPGRVGTGDGAQQGAAIDRLGQGIPDKHPSAELNDAKQ